MQGSSASNQSGAANTAVASWLLSGQTDRRKLRQVSCLRRVFGLSRLWLDSQKSWIRVHESLIEDALVACTSEAIVVVAIVAV